MSYIQPEGCQTLASSKNLRTMRRKEESRTHRCHASGPRRENQRNLVVGGNANSMSHVEPLSRRVGTPPVEPKDNHKAHICGQHCFRPVISETFASDGSCPESASHSEILTEPLAPFSILLNVKRVVTSRVGSRSGSIDITSRVLVRILLVQTS